jgi:U4/U6 small nuclear ribonucleoprotein prp31
MSLADELLADLEEDNDYDESLLLRPEAFNDVKNFDSNNDQSMDVDQPSNSSVRALAQIRDSSELKKVMIEIDKRLASKNTLMSKSSIDGPVEAHPEYKLIVDANNITVLIEDDINLIHKFVKDEYGKRFSELDSLIPTPLEYLMTVKELGNNLGW